MINRVLKALVCIASLGVLGFAFFPVEYKTGSPMQKSPLVIAHRGANEWFNESTLTAYELAAKEGVDYLELDLRQTKDGELVVIHDNTIDRTTNGKGKVSEWNLKELEEFETVEVFGNRMETEEIPTLEQIFQRFQDTEKYYIETRLEDGELAVEEKLIELLNAYGLVEKEKVIIQSFSHKSLERIKELAPSIPLALLFKKGNFSLRVAVHTEYPIIGIESSDVTKRIVDTLHKEGKQVHVFFNNPTTQKKEQKRVKAYQIDGYFTDYINYTKELIKGDSPSSL